MEKPRPIPIEFEETFILEKPAEVKLDGMAEVQELRMEVSTENEDD